MTVVGAGISEDVIRQGFETVWIMPIPAWQGWVVPADDDAEWLQKFRSWLLRKDGGVDAEPLSLEDFQRGEIYGRPMLGGLAFMFLASFVSGLEKRIAAQQARILVGG